MYLGSFDWLVTSIGTVVGVGLLALFYATVRTEWPLNYASLGDDPGVVVNRTFGKYCTFAIVPMYVVALLASTTVGRAGGHAMVCALTIGAIHILRTQGKLIWMSFKQRRSERSNPTIILAAITTVGLLATSWLGGLGPGPAQFVVPPIEEFFNAFWTTAVIVVIAAFISRSTAIRRTVYDALEQSRREVGGGLLRYARETATRYDSDPLLVEAILLTENLQRPGWFRRLEKIKGKVFPAGTYGPMQVWSPHPLTDEESITRAVQEHLTGLRVKKTRYQKPNKRSLHKILRRYNPNPNFISLASDIYEILDHEADASTYDWNRRN